MSFTPSTVSDFNEGRYATASLEAGYNAVKPKDNQAEEEEEWGDVHVYDRLQFTVLIFAVGCCRHVHN